MTALTPERRAELRRMLDAGQIGAPDIVRELLDALDMANEEFDATAAMLELGAGETLAARAEEVMILLKDERARADRHFEEAVSLRGDASLCETPLQDTVLRELNATRSERDHLLQRLADLHNKHRHEFYEAIEKATEKLFREMGFHRNTKERPADADPA